MHSTFVYQPVYFINSLVFSTAVCSFKHISSASNRNRDVLNDSDFNARVKYFGQRFSGPDTFTSPSYFIPQAPTLALTSSRKDVKQLVYFQILQNADNIFLLSDNSAVILIPKV